MTTNFEFGTISNPEEAKQLGQILTQCFNSPPDSWQMYLNRIGLENFRVILQGGQAAGGLGILHMGQWFGSSRVPIAGIAAVGIAPEYRGTGVAAALMTNIVKECHAKGIPLSTLYASTSALYRKVGYEQAGNYCRLTVPTETILLKDRTLPMQRVEATHHEFHELYRQRAIASSGNLDRHQAIWQGIVESPEDVIYAYRIGFEDKPEGYVIFSQKRGDTSYHLEVRDMVALTPAAARRLWTFFADHRSLADKVIWQGQAGDPLLSLLTEQTYKIAHLERWLVRVVDVPKALSMRGYPIGLEAELHLEIQDNVLPDNNGKFVLAVSGGRGEVTRGGRGELRLDVRGLSPLFTGLLTAHQLQTIGKIEGDADSLSTAMLLFASPEPWMPDHF